MQWCTGIFRIFSYFHDLLHGFDIKRGYNIIPLVAQRHDQRSERKYYTLETKALSAIAIERVPNINPEIHVGTENIHTGKKKVSVDHATSCSGVKRRRGKNVRMIEGSYGGKTLAIKGIKPVSTTNTCKVNQPVYLGEKYMIDLFRLRQL